MAFTINKERDNNKAKIKALLKKGYKDLGWANFGASFTNEDGEKESLDLSLYKFRSTNIAYIDHDLKEILHVDMSD